MSSTDPDPETLVQFAETVAKNTDAETAEIFESAKQLREYNVPLPAIERSVREQYDAHDYAEAEIPVTGDAVGVRTTRGVVVIGRAVTPGESPNDLFSITDARIGEGVDDLSPPPEACDDPGVRKKDGHLDVLMLDHDTPRNEHPSCHRLGGVTEIKTGVMVAPRDLVEEEPAIFEVVL